MTTIRTIYRGWHINYDPPPIPVRCCDWQFWHDDFDGSEDSGDRRCGSAASLEAAKAEIDLYQDCADEMDAIFGAEKREA